jgi:predicted lactoylglutathione lyase
LVISEDTYVLLVDQSQFKTITKKEIPDTEATSEGSCSCKSTMEVEVSDGTRRRFEPGDLVLATDTTGSGHITVGVGDPPLEALFVAEA